jgi:hypothetical protein
MQKYTELHNLSSSLLLKLSNQGGCGGRDRNEKPVQILVGNLK